MGTGSHSVTCHPTQANAPRHNPVSQAGNRFTYPGRMEGWVDLGSLIAAPRESNPRPPDRKSDALTVTPPSHRTLKDTPRHSFAAVGRLNCYVYSYNVPTCWSASRYCRHCKLAFSIFSDLLLQLIIFLWLNHFFFFSTLWILYLVYFHFFNLQFLFLLLRCCFRFHLDVLLLLLLYTAPTPTTSATSALGFLISLLFRLDSQRKTFGYCCSRSLRAFCLVQPSESKY